MELVAINPSGNSDGVISIHENPIDWKPEQKKPGVSSFQVHTVHLPAPPSFVPRVL